MDLLMILHILALIVHSVQSIALFALADPTHTVDVTRTVPNLWGSGGSTVVIVYPMAVEFLPPVFLLFAAVNHFIVVIARSGICCTPVKQSSLYTLPWAEYFISASVMNLLILVLCNGSDVMQHLSVFNATATTMVFGILHEWSFAHKKSQRRQWELFAFGCFPFLTAWTLILFNFAYAPVTPPAFVYAVIATMLFLESGFAINQMVHIIIQHRLGYEIGKIALSISAKTILAWLSYGGAANIQRIGVSS